MKKTIDYLIVALVFYVFSFFAGFSIGLFTLFGTVLYFVLSIANLFVSLDKRKKIIFGVLSLVIWLVLVLFIDDAYLFYPFTLFFE